MSVRTAVKQRAAAAGEVNSLVGFPSIRDSPVLLTAGVQRQAGGYGSGYRTGEESTISWSGSP